MRTVPAKRSMVLCLSGPERKAWPTPAQLGWQPRYTAEQALTAFADGLQQRAGRATPPLEAELPGGRVEELKTGVGNRP